jgi:hypothetical protein
LPRIAHATVVLTRRGAEIGTWALMGEPTVDLALVDEVARWQLAARRMGCAIRLRDAAPDLVDLLEFVGLGEVGGKPECGEQIGVEEAVEPGDPAV